jgi:hypothetical protein
MLRPESQLLFVLNDNQFRIPHLFFSIQIKIGCVKVQAVDTFIGYGWNNSAF